MINLLFLFVLCSLTKTSHVVDGRRFTPKEELELERQLNHINNSSIKSSHTKFGYIVDCVDINRQPAFDHPLLKNHKLQRRPNFNVEISRTNPKLEFEHVMCPRGMVPIRRIAKDDVIHAKYLLNNNNFLNEDKNYVTHSAGVNIQRTPSESYHGVSGTVTIYNPRVYKDQISGAYIYVQSGHNDGTTKILAGWHVNPSLYGDDSTYIFSAWTTDNFKSTGCYNTLCPGFVQKHTDKLNVGSRVTNTSAYGGSMVEMSISLQQDPINRDWLLIIENIEIGYFPAELFPNLEVPDELGWGGVTQAPKGVPSPPMGSSYFPDEHFVHACYFRNITYRDPYNHYYEPQESSIVKFNDALNCYGVEYYDRQPMPFGNSVLFGGPGGNCGYN